MINLRICNLKDKEVINICDCKILGFVTDVEFECSTGCILSLIVPGPCKICGFLGRDTEYVIPFKCVRNIGPDVILVDVCVENVLVKCF